MNNTNPVNDNKDHVELSENMEVIGPGQLLKEARQKLSLTVGDISNVLKFKLNLVENIERDLFDHTLPPTYNRGYLRSYAKLVKIDVEEVLSAYELLGIAQEQRNDMQSFSNLAEKQVEHSRIMWISYLVGAILFALMILWWLQEPNQSADESALNVNTELTRTDIKSSEESKTQAIASHNQLDKTSISSNQTEETSESASDIKQNSENLTTEKVAQSQNNEPQNDIEDEDLTTNQSILPAETLESIRVAVTSQINEEESDTGSSTTISAAVFTFSGDCWVNIFDATGERLAWGVKKSGYVMTLTGQPPFKVTLGRPELASIEFNGQKVDMSGFSAGNIAKFTLPM